MKTFLTTLLVLLSRTSFGLLSTTPSASSVVDSSSTRMASSAVTSSESTVPQWPGEACEAGGTLIDEEAMLSRSSFPIAPAELLEKARLVLKKDSGVLDTSLWADDFEFCAPIIGPLSKEEFLEAAGGFNVYDAFPDFDNRYYNLNVDPFEPNRVWFMTRLVATHTGKLFGKEPRTPGEKVVLPPQMFSLAFNEQGLVKELTVGYVVDRRQGNTGGLGGMFGVFYKVGQPLPIPEGYPYKRSWQFRLFTWIGRQASKFKKKKQSAAIKAE